MEQGSWYSGYVGWAAQTGLVEGVGNGQFSPGSVITADQMNLIMERYSALSGQTYEKATGGSKQLTRGEFAVILASLQ
ncbi:hypothetical protein D3C76_1723670 [compost metagenome]